VGSLYAHRIGWQDVLWSRMYCISFRRRSDVEVKIVRAITSSSVFANQSSTWLSHEL